MALLGFKKQFAPGIKIKIIFGGDGSGGATGHRGITLPINTKSYNGCVYKGCLKVQLDNGEIWALNPHCEIELLKD